MPETPLERFANRAAFAARQTEPRRLVCGARRGHAPHGPAA